MAEKKAILILEEDVFNKGKEQWRTYQKDGVTVKVPIGRKWEVPMWVAELAVKVGDVKDFIEL